MYINIETACVYRAISQLHKASDTQAVGHGFEPRH